MSARSVTLDDELSALLDQVQLGLADESALPEADQYLDEEGATVAVREHGRLVVTRAMQWQRPDDVRVRDALTVVVPPPE